MAFHRKRCGTSWCIRDELPAWWFVGHNYPLDKHLLLLSSVFRNQKEKQHPIEWKLFGFQRYTLFSFSGSSITQSQYLLFFFSPELAIVSSWLGFSPEQPIPRWAPLLVGFRKVQITAGLFGINSCYVFLVWNNKPKRVCTDDWGLSFPQRWNAILHSALSENSTLPCISIFQICRYYHLLFNTTSSNMSF